MELENEENLYTSTDSLTGDSSEEDDEEEEKEENDKDVDNENQNYISSESKKDNNSDIKSVVVDSAGSDTGNQQSLFNTQSKLTLF